MKIKFLGTSSGWPLPRLGCTCSICKSKDPKDKRLRPSLLFDDEVLLDISPDIYHQIQNFNIDPTKIKYIILTHAHDDHIMGLYDLGHIYNSHSKPILISTKSVLDHAGKRFGISLFSYRYPRLKPWYLFVTTSA